MDYKHRFLGSLNYLLVAVGLLAVGCVQATASIPEVEVTRENLVFAGIPNGVPTDVPAAAPTTIPTNLPTTISPELAAQLPGGISADSLAQLELPAAGEAYHFPTMTFSYSHVAADLPTGLTSRMRVKEITIRAHEATSSLSFVRGILLTVTKPTDPTSTPTVLIQYPITAIADSPIENSITLPVLNGSYTVNPWEADSTVYTLDIWADLTQLPRQNWAVDVVLTLSGSVEFEF